MPKAPPVTLFPRSAALKNKSAEVLVAEEALIEDFQEIFAGMIEAYRKLDKKYLAALEAHDKDLSDLKAMFDDYSSSTLGALSCQALEAQHWFGVEMERRRKIAAKKKGQKAPSKFAAAFAEAAKLREKYPRETTSKIWERLEQAWSAGRLKDSEGRPIAVPSERQLRRYLTGR